MKKFQQEYSTSVKKKAQALTNQILKKHNIDNFHIPSTKEIELEEKKFLLAVKPLQNQLKKLGVDIKDLSTVHAQSKLYLNKELFHKIEKLLLEWLPHTDNAGVKETIVRFLSVPWSPSSTARLFIDEFKKDENESKSDLKWAIGNALYVFANDEVCDEIISIVSNKKHGRTREMVVAALGRMREPHNKEKANNALINLLNDEDVAGHALMALRKLKVVRARQYIEPFLTHKRTWWRNEAKKAIAQFNKLENKR